MPENELGEESLSPFVLVLPLLSPAAAVRLWRRPVTPHLPSSGPANVPAAMEEKTWRLHLLGRG